MIHFSIWCLEDGVIDVTLVTLQIFVDFIVELKVVVQFVDQLAPHRVNRLYLSLQNDVHRKVLDLLSRKVYSLRILPKIGAFHIVFLSRGVRIFSKGEIHFHFVECVSSSFGLNHQSQLLEILSLELEVVNLSLICLRKHKFGLTARLDVLEIAPISSQLILQLLHARVNNNE